MLPETILNLDAFEALSRQALIFSLFDCLKTGQKFSIISESKAKELTDQLEVSGIPNFHWALLENATKVWKLSISKGSAVSPISKQAISE